MGLKQTIELTHRLLEQGRIDHAFIGGMALSVHGHPRATSDVDYLVDEKDKDVIKSECLKIGFILDHDGPEVLHFSGLGRVDFLLAKRPISRQMLKDARPCQLMDIKCVTVEDLIGLKIQAIKNDPERELQDRSDIQVMAKKHPDLDKNKIKSYADMFSMWDEIKVLL